MSLDKNTSVFSFQVDEFREAKTPEEIKEWEELMENQVRLVGFVRTNEPIGIRSTSCCGGRCDDCDEVQR